MAAGPPRELLVSRIATLQEAIRCHKRAIKMHRAQLQTAASELAAIEADCRARGMALEFVHPSGAGDIHGRDDRSTS